MRLHEALGLATRDCVAIVGGGGKTTIMFRLAAEVASGSGGVVVGGTTRFTPPRSGAMPPACILTESDNAGQVVARALESSPSVTCTTGRGDKGRWLPITEEQVASIAARPEVALTVLEADGSRNRPFKAPGDSEPVIPGCASVVLAVVGLDVVGEPLSEECVHRPELVSSLTGTPLGEPITVATVASVLLHALGGRKCLPPFSRWIPVLNKAEGDRLQNGRELARLLLQGGAERVVLATASAPDPVALTVFKG
jgi:probable selenium-dependent hydroxylase accessory protein YqeC